ncbi:MAG: FkbM family methyltransferase [Mucilaginibacter sp.]
MQPTLREIFSDKYTLPQKVGSLYRFIKWQVISKVFKKKLVFKYTSNSKLLLINGFQALTGNYYFGISDPDVMPFLLHLLTPDDLFVDIGANGGAYTVLASAEKKGHTVAIEAAADTFKGLQQNIAINGIANRVEALNVAVSDINGILPFTSADHATNRVCYDTRDDIVYVEAKTLDTILQGRIPLLMKLDIEGHEHNALLGAHHTISSPGCKALIIEFSNTGEYYGYGNIKTHQLLTGYGFKPYKYHYKNRQLTAFDPLQTGFEFNMIYVKDEAFVQDRLKSASSVVMNGRVI